MKYERYVRFLVCSKSICLALVAQKIVTGEEGGIQLRQETIVVHLTSAKQLPLLSSIVNAFV